MTGPDLDAALAAAPPTRFAPGRDTRLAVLDVSPPAGVPHREPVVLVPGWTGSKEDFLPLLEPLAAAGHRVVAYDQRGQHESVTAAQRPDDLAAQRPDDLAAERPEDFTVARLADDLLALLDALSLGPAHLVGHSFGGLVARAAVLARPDAARSLVLLASGPAALTGPRVERVLALAPLLESGGMAAVHAAMERQAATDPRAQAQPPAWRELLRRRFVASSPVSLQATGAALTSEPDRVAELAAVDVPVLVLYGDADDAWSPEEQAAMAARLGARRVALPGVAHSPALEAPAATAAALLSFWAG